jgi:pimeloyl-ACP methyl ester carboxylesterase
MVAQEMAVDYPERIGDLILVSTTPGWPFAYPMPAVSAALIARTGSLTRDGFVDLVTSFLLADRVPRNVLHAGRRKH